ncbi:MAG: retropepsin-like aspartic protease [Cyanobacteria bacterium]|nr:retropepsin-like aspartic protease [Cyanobacteriota bacterium]MDA0865495.1 retropepsin-like aspartic protease [Cyanobacteriota bacterium]
MGITYAEIELIRGADLVLAEEGYLSADDIRRLKVLALVDTGSSMLVISRSLSKQLALRHVDEVDTELANGTLMRADVVGPVEVRFQNRRTVVNAVVVEADTDVLLGAIPMQGMDVMVDPKREQLILNPDSPDKARMLMK